MSDLEPGVVLSADTVAAMERLAKGPAAKLSPAAQAVMDAAGASEPGIYATIAAALRAAADQVDWSWEPAEQLLAIAAELDMQP